MNPFQYIDEELHCEQVSLAALAQKVGTPAYVYSETAFTSRLTALKRAFESRGVNPLICYSVKAASNLALLKLSAASDCGADIVSGGELFRALKSGLNPKKIVYSGVGKTVREMTEALKAGILMFNVESVAELASLNAVAGGLGLKAPISLRVNPDVDPLTHPYVATGLGESKFGVPMSQAAAAYQEAASYPNLEVIGLSCHIGSQLTKVSPFFEAARKLKALLGELKKNGLDIKYFDLGGGLGISYLGEPVPGFDDYAQALAPLVGEYQLILEPGRSIVGPSGIFLTKVIYEKSNLNKNFLIMDGAMNDLIRPTLYGSAYDIKPIRQSQAKPEARLDIVGPICESGDFLAKDQAFFHLQPGDLIALFNAGAYGFSMSSNYNSRPRAVEVLVKGSQFRVIRARETYDDLIRGESVG